MGGMGPAPKPAFLRQRTNKKSGAAHLEQLESADVPKIPNPDGRTWHPLTVQSWENAWSSAMASQWLKSDIDALGRLAVIWDQFYREPDAKSLSEIRLQEQRFGLSPLDRSRLQWEVSRGEDAEQKRPKSRESNSLSRRDPRAVLKAVS